MTTTPPRSYAADTSTGKLTLTELAQFKGQGRRIAMVTAYDYPSGRLADEAGIDVILVGDSAAMTVLGCDSTVPATLEEMLVLTRATTRGARRPIVVADLPFGTYQVSDERALDASIRLLKEGGADAVKLEGGGPAIDRARAIVAAGIPVMGHLGLTPQSATMLGGFKAQGRTARQAAQMVADAVALEEAGCFALVLEAVPPAVAARATARLSIPTIGIGAGPDCDGQVLVWHDLLGVSAGRSPKFVKRYAEVGAEIRRALEAFAEEVRGGAFPEERHTYAMPDEELALLDAELAGR